MHEARNMRLCPLWPAVEPHITLEPSIITENGKKIYHWECYEKKYCISIRDGSRQMGLRLECKTIAVSAGEIAPSAESAVSPISAAVTMKSNTPFNSTKRRN